MTIKSALDITNLVCASVAFWSFSTTQIVAFFIARTRAHDERIRIRDQERRLREGGDEETIWPPRDEFLYDACRQVEPPLLVLSERSGILLSVTCALMVVTFVTEFALVKHLGYSSQDNRVELAYLGLSISAWLLYGILPCFNAYCYLGPGILTMVSQIVTEILYNHHASEEDMKDRNLWPVHSRIIILWIVAFIYLGAVLQLQVNPDEPDLSTPPSPLHISYPYNVHRNYGTNDLSDELIPSQQHIPIHITKDSGPSVPTSSQIDRMSVDTTHSAVLVKATPSHLTIANPKRRLTGLRKPSKPYDPDKNRDGYRMIEVEPGVYVDDSSMSGESVYLRGHSPPRTRRRATAADLPPSAAVNIAGRGDVDSGGPAMEFTKSAVAALGGNSGSLLTMGLEAVARELGGGVAGEVAEEEEDTLPGGLE